LRPLTNIESLHLTPVAQASEPKRSDMLMTARGTSAPKGSLAIPCDLRHTHPMLRRLKLSSDHQFFVCDPLDQINTEILLCEAQRCLTQTGGSFR